MIPVSCLSEEVQSKIGGRDLIVFDGECVLCSHFFQFVLQYDRARRFYFSTAQSSIGQSLYQELKLPTDDFETILVIADGQIYQSLDAICAVLRSIGGFWALGALTRFFPKVVKDQIYFAIARRRYRLFGKLDTCIVPEENVAARFIA